MAILVEYQKEWHKLYKAQTKLILSPALPSIISALPQFRVCRQDL